MSLQPIRIPNDPGGRRFVLVRTACIAGALLVVALFVAGLPAYYEEFHTLSIISDDTYREIARTNLDQLGISVGFYAGYFVALSGVFAATCFTVAAVIFLRKSGDPVALFVALLLVLLGATFTGSVNALGTLHPTWAWLGDVLTSISLGFMVLFFYIFPDGRFVPRRARWPVFFFVAYVVLASSLPGSMFNPENWPDLPYALFSLVWILTGVLAQTYRYRWVSGPVERQQTKWVVFGFAVALTGYVAVISLRIIFPALEPGSLADLTGATVAWSFVLLIPLSIGIAILRYRLFDIDIIINRTLVYGALTAMLAGFYFGGVIGLQFVFRTLTGQDSQLAIVASTLLIAALFSPLRRGIQSFIDRRFYRKKYDARKTLEAFSVKLRNETDLDRLSGELVSVVQETLQPAHVSLWLRKPEKVK